MARRLADLSGTRETAFQVGRGGAGQVSLGWFNGFLGRFLWNPTANRDIVIPDVAGTMALAAPVRTGSTVGYTIAVNSTASTTVAATANQLRAFPWIISAPVTFDQVVSEVTTLAAATNYRIGIYTDTGNCYPNSLIANTDAASYSGAAAAVNTQALAASVTLQPGLYWLAWLANGTPTLRAVPIGAIAPILGWQLTGGANPQRTCWQVAQTFGALPSSFPTGAALTNNIAAPMAIWRSV